MSCCVMSYYIICGGARRVAAPTSSRLISSAAAPVAVAVGSFSALFAVPTASGAAGFPSERLDHLQSP